jgi:hypothetical protein
MGFFEVVLREIKPSDLRLSVQKLLAGKLKGDAPRYFMDLRSWKSLPFRKSEGEPRADKRVQLRYLRRQGMVDTSDSAAG